MRKPIADVHAGKPDDNMFAPAGRQFLNQMQSQMGTVKSMKFVNVSPTGPDAYRVETDKGSWLFRICLSPEGKAERTIVQPVQQ